MDHMEGSLQGKVSILKVKNVIIRFDEKVIIMEIEKIMPATGDKHNNINLFVAGEMAVKHENV